MTQMGYVQPNGRPDVSRFSKDFGFDKTFVHYWVNDERTPHKELDRLVEVLQCTRSWLVFGEGPAPKAPKRFHPIAGGSAVAPTPPAARAPRQSVKSAAYRTTLRRVFRWVVGQPVMSPMPAYA